MIITGEQLRAARAMVRIEQADLARRANVSVETIKRLERTEGPVSANVQTVDAIVRALEVAGIEFTNGAQPGVRLPRKREEGKAVRQRLTVGTRVAFLRQLPAPDPKYLDAIGEIFEPERKVGDDSKDWVRWPDGYEAGYPAGTLGPVS